MDYLKRFHEFVGPEYFVKGSSLSDEVATAAVVLATVFLVYLVGRVVQRVGPVRRARRLGLDVLNRALGISSKMSSGLADIRREIHEMKKPDVPTVYSSLPHLSDREIVERLERVKAIDRRPEAAGRQGGNYYFSSKEDTREFVSRHAADFLYTNIMHFDNCPGSQLIENELIQFMLELTNAPAGAVGTVTTGGTESILLAMLTYRELGLRRGIAEPEVVMPDSAHVAFLKAAFYFRLKVRQVKVDERTGAVSARKLLKAVGRDTVAVVCTAGTYAHGVVDPVGEVCRALEGSAVWVHVDCCLGGFLVTASALKGDGRLPVVDFRHARVGSVSIDPHKYGEAPKGCSTVLFRTEELKKHSLFYHMQWNGGIYATPSLPGSRGCAPFVGAWISLVRSGKQGLVRHYELITSTLDEVVRTLRGFPELEVIGDPKCCVVSFTAKKDSGVSIFDLQEAIKRDGWHLPLMQRPYAIHITVTKNNAENLRNCFKASIATAIAYAKSQPECSKGKMYNVFYGTLLRLPDGDMIENAIKTSMIEVNRLHPES